jgi:hypothetical protein
VSLPGRTLLSFALAACALAAVGCDDNLPRASEITHMRVLGALTQVDSEPQRATPKPGEKAKLSWSVVFPDNQDDSELASLFLVCTAPTMFSGTPVCQELIDVAQGGDISEIVGGLRGKDAPDCGANPDRTYPIGPFSVVCVSQTPQFEISIAKNVKGAARLVQGIICRNGTPQLDDKDPTGLHCKPHDGVEASDLEAIAVYGTVPIQYSDDQRDLNPDMDAAHFLLHDPALPWQPITPELADTLDDDSCLTEAKAKHVAHSDGNEELLTIEYDADARQTRDGSPDALEFSSYTTFGELSQRFTEFASDAKPPLKNEFHWKISADQRTALNGKSKRVRFYFTVIDHLGGFAVTSRDLCIDRQ